MNNRTVYCKDNLEILRGMNSETIDMIYLDPPFNKKKSFHAPIGSAASGASFKDQWFQEDIKKEWVEDIRSEFPDLHAYLSNVAMFAEKSDFCYLTYMAIRIIECKRVLKPTGSLFYHCDDTMQHYIKLMLDIVFGRDNFRNEINWKRGTSHNNGGHFGRITDAILYYAKSNNHKQTKVYVPRDEAAFNKWFSYKELETGRQYQPADLTFSTAPGDGSYRLVNGKKYYSKARWKWNQEKFDSEILKNPYIIHVTSGDRLKYKLYSDEDKGIQAQDLWDDIPTRRMPKNERLGYPTQKPLALMHRIIEASTNEGDMVLDPFMGGGTTCVAAEQLNRKWIGVDVSMEAFTIVKSRLITDVNGQVDGQTDMFGAAKAIIAKTDAPVRNSNDDVKEKKYVYIISNDAWPGHYKVGIATNMKSRLSSYNTGDPNSGYKIRYTIKTEFYREVEKLTHDSFPGTKEWVQAEPMDLIMDRIKELINKFENA